MVRTNRPNVNVYLFLKINIKLTNINFLVEAVRYYEMLTAEGICDVLEELACSPYTNILVRQRTVVILDQLKYVNAYKKIINFYNKIIYSKSDILNELLPFFVYSSDFEKKKICTFKFKNSSVKCS